jgi:hypothetical protein
MRGAQNKANFPLLGAKNAGAARKQSQSTHWGLEIGDCGWGIGDWRLGIRGRTCQARSKQWTKNKANFPRSWAKKEARHENKANPGGGPRRTACRHELGRGRPLTAGAGPAYTCWPAYTLQAVFGPNHHGKEHDPCEDRQSTELLSRSPCSSS